MHTSTIPRLSWGLSALLLTSACTPPSQGISEGIEGGVYSLDIQYNGVPNGILGGVLRLDSRRREDGRLNGLPLTRLDLTPTVVAIESSLQRSNGTSTRMILNANRRVDRKTLTGEAGLCNTDRLGNVTCRSGSFTAVRIERLAGEADANGLALVGETNLVLPSAPLAPSRDPDLRRTTDEVAHEGHSDFDFGFGSKAGPDAVQPSVNVRVAGDLAYVAKYGDGLVVVDVSDLARPRPVGQSKVVSPVEIYNDVKIAPGGQHVLMASNTRGMVVIDVSNPAAPVEVARAPSGPCDGTNRPAGCSETDTSDVHTLYLEGTRAYLSDISLGGIRIVDVSNPAAPVELGQYLVEGANGFVHDLMIRNGIAYLNAWQHGFLIVDCNVPATPVLLGRYTYGRSTSHSSWVEAMGGRLIALNGDEDFTAHLRVLDVTDPADIRLLSEWQTRPEVSIHNVMMLGTRGYLAHYQDGVRVLDLSDPAQPRPLAHFNTWSTNGDPGVSFYEGVVGMDVDLVRRLIFVADSQRGLLILREQF